MKTIILLVLGFFLLVLMGAGPAWPQQPPQPTPQQPQPPPPLQQEQQAQPQVVEQLNLTVEEAVICTGIMDRAPQGVPTGAPAAAATDTTTAATTTTGAAAAPVATAATAAPTGGGGDPFPFAAGVGKLYCFTKVSGATTATTLKHIWYFGDTVVHTLELSLGGSPWRTWSNKTIPSSWTGTGKVEIQDANGTLLKTVNFLVQ